MAPAPRRTERRMEVRMLLRLAIAYFVPGWELLVVVKSWFVVMSLELMQGRGLLGSNMDERK